MISRLIYINFAFQVKVVLALEIIVWNGEEAEAVAVAAATATILTAEVAAEAVVAAVDMVGAATIPEVAVVVAEAGQDRQALEATEAIIAVVTDRMWTGSIVKLYLLASCPRFCPANNCLKTISQVFKK